MGATSWVLVSVIIFFIFRVPFHFFSNFFLFHNAAAAAAKSLQSCLTLCDPIDGSPLGSSVLGILQARTLEWVAISFSNAWKWKMKVKSHLILWVPSNCQKFSHTSPLELTLPLGFRSYFPLPTNHIFINTNYASFFLYSHFKKHNYTPRGPSQKSVTLPRATVLKLICVLELPGA